MSDDELLFNIGMKIRDCRKNSNLSLEGLASKCKNHKTQLQRIELGKNNYGILTLKKVCDALNIELDDLFSNGCEC